MLGGFLRPYDSRGASIQWHKKRGPQKGLIWSFEKLIYLNSPKFKYSRQKKGLKKHPKNGPRWKMPLNWHHGQPTAKSCQTCAVSLPASRLKSELFRTMEHANTSAISDFQVYRAPLLGGPQVWRIWFLHPALAYHFCLNLPAAFTQHGALPLVEPCRVSSKLLSATIHCIKSAAKQIAFPVHILLDSPVWTNWKSAFGHWTLM